MRIPILAKRKKIMISNRAFSAFLFMFFICVLIVILIFFYFPILDYLVFFVAHAITQNVYYVGMFLSVLFGLVWNILLRDYEKFPTLWDAIGKHDTYYLFPSLSAGLAGSAISDAVMAAERYKSGYGEGGPDLFKLFVYSPMPVIVPIPRCSAPIIFLMVILLCLIGVLIVYYIAFRKISNAKSDKSDSNRRKEIWFAQIMTIMLFALGILLPFSYQPSMCGRV